MKHRRLAPGFLIAFVVSAWASAAQASPMFPGVVETTLHMPCAPPCVICHTTNFGGIGTAVRPFGLAVHELGAHAGNTAGLRRALAVLENTQAVAELREGRNPNDGTAMCVEYGCAVGSPEGHGGALVTVLLIVGLWARRRIRPGLRCRSKACIRSASGTCATR